MISSVTFLAYPGEGYSSNWILLVQGLMVPVVLIGIIWFVVPLYRKMIGLSTYEYFEKRFGRSDREYLKAGRWIVAVSGILSILIAMLYVSAGSDGVLGIVFTLYAIFSGGISGIFLLGLFSDRTNRQGMNIGIAACILFTMYAFLTSTRIGAGEHKSLLLDIGVYNFT
jgi:SSS family solute:Na+ symporter